MNLSSDLKAIVTKRDREYALELLDLFTRQPPVTRPSDWCEENLELRTTTIKGRFSLRGREYIREPLNEIADDDLHFQTCCWGTGCAKTTKNLGQVMWVFENDPASMLYVVPTKEGQGGAREFNNTAIIPTIEATGCFKAKIPTGKYRHNFAGLKCIFAGNTLHLVGANSPGQLAGPRRRIVWLDESDKFKEQLGREASADYLANERTKQVPRSKLIRGSTPSLEEFGIWPHLMASDLRRRFLPCPHCSKRFVLVRSVQFTVLPVKMSDGTPIPLAEMRWDKEARRRDGSWDMDRVIRSTRFECPHCHGHIRDEHREQMDKHGQWIPTNHKVVGHHGYHLPSFYAPHVDFESSFGGMAKKFLDAHESGQGMRGYVNSECAEVDAAQEHASDRIEIESKNIAGPDWTALMSCDFQKLWPYLWFVIQKWSSFKLHPPFVGELNLPDHLKAKATALDAPAVVRELLRFDSRTGDFPLLDWLIAQKLTGEKLTKLYVETCQRNTLDLGRWIYRKMGLQMPKGGDSEIIVAGHCELSGDDAWQELREIQQQFHVGETFLKWGMSPNRAVMVDSGYAEEHNPEVLRKCFESGAGGRQEFYDPIAKKFAQHRTHDHCRPVPIDGWIPFKGYPITKRWRVNGIETSVHWAADDPFKGLSEAERYGIGVLEAASDFYFHKWMDSRERQKEIRTAIADGVPYRGNVWSVANDVQLLPAKKFTIEQFSAQLNAKGRNADNEIWERGTGGSGKRRHPDHLNDCCRNMFPLAEVHGFFSYETKGEK